ncbi:hypothetical protein FJT64_003085 [Amphibalanus amphitrite]|uniref:Mab-21-like HhH/H2TH-like domain-containing protein n=1 Tax=Amphibalanus amphitrite TaxID=1232801 RepID=A0A6A4W310_AMPAM|nr:hypothetical protein FJT64_003085 [Amphibalanus amphitrite]
MSNIFAAISAHRLEQGRRLVGTLSPAVQQLVERCGSAAHLVADTLLVADDLVWNHGPGRQAYITACEVSDAVDDLVRRPLLSALAEVGAAAAAARCRHCQPRQPLRLVTCNRSGSSAEGLADHVIGREGDTSDFDIMLEFDGPFRWAPPGAEPADIEPQSAPQLWARPTDNAGFVTLHWVRTDRCGHEEPLEALPADSVRRLMVDFCRVMTGGEITPTGPAVNVKGPGSKSGGFDYVFCLLVRGWWPAPVWPDGAPWDTSFGVHLVPTGRPGSKTESIEYRISLSRAELLAVRQLCPGLRAARQAIIGSLRLVREHLTPLLMACCEKQWSLDILLEGRPTEPLSERQLRLRLGRTLLLQAVVEGIQLRPTAPCWESWWSDTIPHLARAAPRLLQWYHHMMSGTHDQQCYLLMAWSVVDPADLADGEPMTSPRPAGLTAEPDTPRGRAELLLRPELLLRALGEAVPREMDRRREEDREEKEAWEGNYQPPATYQQRREELEQAPQL